MQVKITKNYKESLQRKAEGRRQKAAMLCVSCPLKNSVDISQKGSSKLEICRMIHPLPVLNTLTDACNCCATSTVCCRDVDTMLDF